MLRAIGLIMVIFAHASPPDFLFQIRNFDVPLMVLISGMSFGLTYTGQEPYRAYVWKRIKRLLLPTWIFLTIYLSLISILGLSSVEDLSVLGTVRNYLLVGSVGYLWIIRVFLMIALVAPFISAVREKTGAKGRYLSKLLLIFVGYEVCRYFFLPYMHSGLVQEIAYLTILLAVPYSLIFALGLRVFQNSNKENMLLLLSSLSVFLVSAFLTWRSNGSFVPTQQYKYPPSTYFLSYALTVSLFFWIIGHELWNAVAKNKTLKRFFLFVAKNSMWIYLWHLPLAEASKSVSVNFVYKFFAMLLISICITFVQVWFVRNIMVPKASNARLQKNLKVLLTG